MKCQIELFLYQSKINLFLNSNWNNMGQFDFYTFLLVEILTLFFFSLKRDVCSYGYK